MRWTTDIRFHSVDSHSTQKTTKSAIIYIIFPSSVNIKWQKKGNVIRKRFRFAKSRVGNLTPAGVSAGDYETSHDRFFSSLCAV